VIKVDEFGPLGPDLAFLQIPDETLGWLKAKNSFYNLSKRRDAVLSGERPSKSHVDCITGIIHELTEEVPSGRRRVRRIDFYNIWSSLIALRKARRSLGVRRSSVQFQTLIIKARRHQDDGRLHIYPKPRCRSLLR
jgi:hypothetical protein